MPCPTRRAGGIATARISICIINLLNPALRACSLHDRSRLRLEAGNSRLYCLERAPHNKACRQAGDGADRDIERGKFERWCRAHRHRVPPRRRSLKRPQEDRRTHLNCLYRQRHPRIRLPCPPGLLLPWSPARHLVHRRRGHQRQHHGDGSTSR